MSSPNSSIESVLVENRVFPPSDAIVKAARISGMAGYEALCAEADKDFEGFWARLARENLQWTKPFTRTLDESMRRSISGLPMANSMHRPIAWTAISVLLPRTRRPSFSRPMMAR